MQYHFLLHTTHCHLLFYYFWLGIWHWTQSCLSSTMSDLQLATAHGPTNTSPTQHTYSAQLSAVNTHSILIVGPAALHSQADLNIWKTNLLPVSLDRSIFTNSIHALMRLRNTQLYRAMPGYNSSVTHFSFSFHDEWTQTNPICSTLFKVSVRTMFTK